MRLQRLSAHITSIMASGQFLKPMRASQVALGASELLVWTVPDVDTSMDYRFVMQVLRMTSTAPPWRPRGAQGLG
ncbi:unnamed protein product, partial [Prorocentrum cordatum]